MSSYSSNYSSFTLDEDNSSNYFNSSSNKIINKPNILKSTEEAEKSLNLPWTPPPPVSRPIPTCRLSNDDVERIFDIVVTNNLVFIVLILLILTFGLLFFYSILMGSIEELCKFQFHKFVNVTKMINKHRC